MLQSDLASELMTSESEIATVHRTWNTAPAAYRMSVVPIESVDILEDYVDAWEDLVANAIEVNPFYEPWMLMPALRGLGAGKNLPVVLVLDVEQGEPVLCGVFPLEKKPRYKGLPVSSLSLWQHIYCPVCTPLVRKGRETECLEAFLDWLTSESDCSLMEFNLIPGDGAFHRFLNDCLFERGITSLVCESYTRALFRPAENADKYLEAAVSAKHRREMGRVKRRLSEQGKVEFDELQFDGDIDAWLDEFMQLEASSWKGEQGGAFSCVESNRDYFVTIAGEAFKRGRLLMSAVRLNGRPLAQRLSFIAGFGAFAFKTAYDENHAGFSPGVLLEIDNIRRLHARTDIDWMDSCATPIHFINRLWVDRRSIKTVLISAGSKTGDLVVALTPLLKGLNRRLRSIKQSPNGNKEKGK